MKRAVIIDYGVGNIRSVMRVLESCKSGGEPLDVVLSGSRDDISSADLIMLPGVGAFNAATEQLSSVRDIVVSRVKEESTPLVAVCLGMQLLFDKSEEGHGIGLGLFSGNVTSLTAQRVPHMGWNTIEYDRSVGPRWAYFAHSFACRPDDESLIAGRTTYQGDTFPSIIRTGNVLATQFHPEKSDVAGVALLKDFVSEVLS